MGTFNDFIEKLQNDEEFAASVNAAANARLEAGDTDIIHVLPSAAEEFGYSITEEEIHAFRDLQKANAVELSEEEMGKVAGGSAVAVALSITVVTFSIMYKTVK